MNEDIIISDVGGTNGRFGIAQFSKNQKKPIIKSIQVFPCKNYSSFIAMLEAYIKTLGTDIPKIAHFAIAGEIRPRHGNLWHFNWDISADEIEKKFDFEHVRLFNDYEALVYAIPILERDDFLNLTPDRKALKNAPFSVLGIGTGLGGSIGVTCQNRLQAISTELGHISYSPKSSIEMDLNNHLQKTISHISNETLLSGLGLKRIYDFLTGSENSNITPEYITELAHKGDDADCVKAVQLFLSILASVAGDIALVQGAKGGVYIGGGIIPKIASLIKFEDFKARFNDKGPMVSYVKEIPIKIITAPMSSLLGAAVTPSR